MIIANCPVSIKNFFNNFLTINRMFECHTNVIVVEWSCIGSHREGVMQIARCFLDDYPNARVKVFEHKSTCANSISTIDLPIFRRLDGYMIVSRNIRKVSVTAGQLKNHLVRPVLSH